MYGDEERAVMERYAIWRYPDLPSGYERVDFYLSGAGTAIPAARESVDLERAAGFIRFTTSPSFHLHAHMRRNDDIACFNRLKEILERPGKRMEIFIHLKGNLEIERLDVKTGSIFICLEDWQAHYPDIAERLSAHRIFLEIPVVPENAGTLRDIIHTLYGQGLRIFMTRFDPRPRWTEATLKLLEMSCGRLGGLYLEALRKREPFFWDELDERLGCLLSAPCVRCGMGETMLALSPEGHMYPCRFLLERGERSDLVGELSRGLHFEFRKIQKRLPAFYRHPHYCRFECGHLRAGDTYDSLYKYHAILDRLSEGIFSQARAEKARTGRTGRTGPFAGATPLLVRKSVYKPVPSLRPPGDEKPLAGPSCGDEEDVQDLYDDRYLEYMRWSPERNPHRKSSIYRKGR